MKKTIIALLALITLIGVVAFFVKNTSQNSTVKSLDFEMSDAKGVSHSSKNWLGRPVIIHFWASWCPPCLEEIGHWVNFTHKFDGKKIQFVAISLDKSFADLEKVLKPSQTSPQLISLLDFNSIVSDQFGTYQFPETYLLDHNFKIVKKWVGGQNWEDPKTIQLVEQVISKAR